jgi:hypothetical protein
MAMLRDRIESAFQIPLYRSQLEALGRLAVIFGQIDFLMTGIISHLLYIDTMAGFTQMDDVTSGRKLGILRKNLYRVKNLEARTLLEQFDDAMGGLVERRNHVFHGIWGWHLKDGKSRPGCYYPKKKDVTVYPEKLAEYGRLLAQQAHALQRAFCLIHEIPAPGVNDRRAVYLYV